MSPCLSAMNKAYYAMRNVKSASQFALAGRTAQPHDFDHINLAEFGRSTRLTLRSVQRHQSSAIGMMHVARCRNPFEVDARWVRLITIDVVDHIVGQLAGAGNECDRDEPMYTMPHFVSVDAEDDGAVAVPVDLASQDVADGGALRRANAPNATEITDRKPAFVTDDWPPFFDRIVGRLFEHFDLLCRGVMRAAATTARPLQFTRLDASLIAPGSLDHTIEWRGART